MFVHKKMSVRATQFLSWKDRMHRSGSYETTVYKTDIGNHNIILAELSSSGTDEKCPRTGTRQILPQHNCRLLHVNHLGVPTTF